VDTTPSNIIRRPDGTVTVFDREWRWKTAIPIQWVVLRGLVNALIWSGPVSGPLARMTAVDVANEVLSLHGAKRIGQDLLVEIGTLEDCFQDTVHARPPASRFLAFVTSPISATGQKLSAQRIDELEQELDRTLASWSWKLTQPLRRLHQIIASSDRSGFRKRHDGS
jgi:hypothetical protein